MDKEVVIEQTGKLEDWLELLELTKGVGFFNFNYKQFKFKVHRKICEKLGEFFQKYREPFNLGAYKLDPFRGWVECTMQ